MKGQSFLIFALAGYYSAGLVRQFLAGALSLPEFLAEAVIMTALFLLALKGEGLVLWLHRQSDRLRRNRVEDRWSSFEKATGLEWRSFYSSSSVWPDLFGCAGNFWEAAPQQASPKKWAELVSAQNYEGRQLLGLARSKKIFSAEAEPLKSQDFDGRVVVEILGDQKSIWYK